MTPPSRLVGRSLAAVLAAVLLSTTGCAYVGDRLLDLTDVVDVKYGAALGVGAKVEVTHYLGAGVGLAVLGYNREWYGRRSFESEGCAFVHFAIIGADGGAHGCRENDTEGEMSTEGFDGYMLLCNVFALDDYYVGWIEEQSNAAGDTTGYVDLPLIDHWRVGAEVVVLPVQFGLFLNLGQLADFVLGLVTIDIAHDDEIRKGDVFEWPRDRAARLEAEAATGGG